MFGSLMVKLVTVFLLVALVPIGIVGYLSFSKARDALQEAALGNLQGVLEGDREDIIAYLDQNLSEVKYLASNPGVESAFKSLADYLDYASYLDYAKANPNAPVDMKTEDYQRLLSGIDPMFIRFLETFEREKDFQDILLVVGEKRGLIMYTSKKLGDLGKSLNSDAGKDSALARLSRRVWEGKSPALSDFTVYAPAETVSAFLGVPVFRDDKQMQGVLVLRFGVKRLNEILAGVSGMGRTGAAFVVGADGLIRAGSGAYAAGALKTKIESEAVKEALKGSAGVGEKSTADGVSALNAWAPVGLPSRKELGANFDWAIAAKVDSAEAFRAVGELGWRVILIGLCIGAVVTALAIILARALTRPISLMGEKANQISQGDLRIEIPEMKGGDEIEGLADSFRRMANILRDQSKRLLEGVSVLMTAASEITTTISQVGANTSRVSAAITQTTTTVEELRQSAMVAKEKAQDVARSSREAAGACDEGKKATENTIERIHVIRGQMESIGETVVKLSDHSQAIENIISVVQDLADQSNLLAVNASIEAAKAGEHGKGFAVVAHEIKSLAQQSRDATDQIKTILDDTRKWVSAVVMATEQGARAVQAGVNQSVIAGGSIETLASNVTQASQSASVIEASTDQQFVGVDQVSQAMASVNMAIQESVEGMRQLDDSARRLHELGTTLQNLMDRFKV